MKALLTATAILEGLTGFSLLVMPSLTVSLLVGAEIGESAGLVVGRVAGAAIFALAIACWQARGGERVGPAAGVVAAMLFYNAVVASILVFAGLRLGLQSALTWPVIVLHSVLAVWCLLILSRTRTKLAKI